MNPILLVEFFQRIDNPKSSLQRIFSILSQLYIRPGTRFDVTHGQFGQTERRRENNMFQGNKITLGSIYFLDGTGGGGPEKSL